MAERRTNAEIAVSLFNSEDMVWNHMHSILRKYEIKTLNGAVLVAIHSGTSTVD